MKKLKEVYRLKFELGYTNRQIGRSVNISPGTVSDYLNLFKITGLSWADLSTQDDECLEKLVFRHPSSVASSRPHPDWATVHMALKRKGVTLLLLWDEYRQQYPQGLGYTQFTKRYHAYAKTLDPVMRLPHKAGEKTFVDYAGLTMDWLCPKTGQIHSAEV